jgi:DnaJ-class molecular chaperone
MSIDPYGILGVSKSSTQDEIKSAYRKLAKKLHPDLNPGNKAIEDKFKQVNNAYEMVGTPEERTKFDRGDFDQAQFSSQRKNQERPFYYETQEPGSRYSSRLFEDLFGDHLRPEDEQYSMDIDFVTSILGGEQEITLPTGKKMKVKIPSGLKSGTRLRLPSKDIQKQGHIYIAVHVKPSSVFRRIDNNIETDLSISLPEAVLGGEVQVQTVDGPIMLNVPKGLSSGSKVRVKGKGVPLLGQNRGDQFVIIKIVMPTLPDAQLEAVILEWSKSHSYNPRLKER